MRERTQSIGEVDIDTAGLIRPTPDELHRWAATRRVFVSSVMEMGATREAAIAGIQASGAEPVAWELITPRPVAAEDAWADGVRSSDSFLRLGPPFRPDHPVRTGKGIFRAAPVTADLDLLFTCSTIVEARDQTRARRRGG